MTKERFEELALIMAKVEFNTDWECDDWETQSEKWKNDFANGRRDALAAVYPLIRDDVIDECLKSFSKITGHNFNHPHQALDATETAIRALKSKDTKL